MKQKSKHSETGQVRQNPIQLTYKLFKKLYNNRMLHNAITKSSCVTIPSNFRPTTDDMKPQRSREGCTDNRCCYSDLPHTTADD